MRVGIWNTFPKFLLLSIGIALVLMLVFCPRCFLTWDGIVSLIPDFLYYEQRISWIAHPAKRLVVTTVTYLIYAFLVSYVIVFIYAWIDGQLSLDDIPWKRVASYATEPMYIALIIMAIFTTRSWLVEWKKSALEAEQLKNEKLSSQYQSLKDQLNPHFLFNSLNVLSSLVYEDADRSAAFIQKLSKIYRYVLEAQKEQLIELDKELGFAKNYLELQKIRFEDSLQYVIDIDSTVGLLPPLSLQLLLENAIKHNIASEDKPLLINIFRKGNELWVSNTYQPKLNQSEHSTGVGLNNIKMRYELLSYKNMEVTQTSEEFLVKLPILELS